MRSAGVSPAGRCSKSGC